MNRLVCFLMVGLAFTVLQVSTVAAQAPGAPVLTIGDPMCNGSSGPPVVGCPNYVQLDCANAGSPTEVAACWDGIANATGAPGTMPPPTGAPGMPPMMAPNMGDPNMPPPMAPPTGAPGMPPMMAPGTMPPPVDISHCADMPPTTRPACEAQAHANSAPTPVMPPMTPPPGMAPPLDCPPGTANPLCGPGGHHDGPPPGEHHDGPPPGGHHPPGAPPLDCPPGSGNPLCGPGGHHDGPPPGAHHDGPDCAALPTPGEVAACWDRKNAAPGGPDGHHPPGKHHDGPPPGKHHDGPPPGAHHDGPPIDPRSGQPFTEADENKYEWAAKECEENQGVLKDTTAEVLMKDGFTRPQLEDLCRGSAHDGPPPGDKTGEFGTPPGDKK